MKHKDEIIIRGIIDGDEKILTRFYEENMRYIQGCIFRNQGNLEDLEDVFQDALVILYQKLNSDPLGIRGSIKTYFYGICKNIWRNKLKKSGKLITENNQKRFDKESKDNLISDIENQEREHLYRKYFQKLSTDNKDLLNLFFERRSMKEISVITGYSEAYTRRKKFLAKKKLTEMIEEDPIYEELIVA